MNAETAGWSRRYQTALRKGLESDSASSLPLAAKLGCQAVTLGMETLDVARIHEQALTTLAVSGGSSRLGQSMIAWAKRFFAETIVPIEKTHRAALKDDIRVNQLTQTLRRRTMESSASLQHLKRGAAQRQAAETALKKSGQHRRQLLRESRRLQKCLRVQAREMFAAQENERHKNSRELHNEIAQILLAINLRLLTVKTSAKSNTENLEKEIAETLQLVQKSVKTIQQLTHEFGDHYER